MTRHTPSSDQVQTRALFLDAVERFRQAGIPDPELEVSVLLSHVLKITRTALLLAGDKPLSEEQIGIFEEIAARRLAREPLAYIIGEKEFWSLPFTVSRDVLIPRPETEFLLEKALARLKDFLPDPGREMKVLDLGTGSGVIAIVLALELASAKVTAVDRSYKALKVARDNARRHNVAERIEFINADWLTALKAGAGYDAVVANPPYIAREFFVQTAKGAQEILQPEVGRFEPKLALDGGKDGLEEIKRIAAELTGILVSGAWVFMEVGADQERAILDIFAKTGAYDSRGVILDYAGRPRVFQARRR